MPLTTAFGKQKQEDLSEFKASLRYMSYLSQDYKMRTYLKNKNKPKRQQKQQQQVLIKDISPRTSLSEYATCEWTGGLEAISQSLMNRFETGEMQKATESVLETSFPLLD